MMSDEAKHKPLPCFKSDLRQAIRDGMKTQTRRPIKPQPDGEFDGPRLYCPSLTNRRGVMRPGPEVFGIWDTMGEWSIRSPYAPGDICYLREPIAYCPGHGEWQYEDGREPTVTARFEGLRNRKTNHVTSANFPRVCARTFVRITGVRVEQLGDIIAKDAIKEGAPNDTLGKRQWFERAWQSFYGNWNPELWVWVVEWELRK